MICSDTHSVGIAGLGMLRKTLQRSDGLDLDADIRCRTIKLRKDLDVLLGRRKGAFPDITYSPKHPDADVPHVPSPLLAGARDVRANRTKRTPYGIKDRPTIFWRETRRPAIQICRHGKENIVQALERADMNGAER